MSQLKEIDINNYEYRGKYFPKPYADFSNGSLTYKSKVTWEDVDKTVGKIFSGSSKEEVIDKVKKFIDTELD